MTGEREPDVIERMVMAFLDQYAKDQSNMAGAMLAAVRELRDILHHEGGNPSLLPGTDANQAYDASNVIERIILDHERRSEGKGE